jgi:hypothetical protein
MADYFFLGRELPSTQSWLSLCGLLVGAIGYALTDSSYNGTNLHYVSLLLYIEDLVFLLHFFPSCSKRLWICHDVVFRFLLGPNLLETHCEHGENGLKLGARFLLQFRRSFASDVHW